MGRLVADRLDSLLTPTQRHEPDRSRGDCPTISAVPEAELYAAWRVYAHLKVLTLVKIDDYVYKTLPAVVTDVGGSTSGLCLKRGHVRKGSCVTSTAGPHGEAQLYERWRRALRVRQSGADLKPPQAAVVKSDGGERCGNVGI